MPVTCPTCAAESWSSFTVLKVADGIAHRQKLSLHTTCHEAAWDASEGELQRVRVHLGQTWITKHTISVA